MTAADAVPSYARVFWQHVRQLRGHLEGYVDHVSAARIAGSAFQDMFLFACHDEATRWGTYQRLYGSTEYMLRRVKERSGSYLPANYVRSFPVPCRLELCQLAGLYAAIASVAELVKLGHEDRVDAAAAIAALVEKDLYQGQVWHGHRDIQRGVPILRRLSVAAELHACRGIATCTHGASTWEREDVRSQIWRERTLKQGGYPEDGCSHEVHHPHRADTSGRDDQLVGRGSVRLVEPEHGLGADGELTPDVGSDA